MQRCRQLTLGRLSSGKQQVHKWLCLLGATAYTCFYLLDATSAGTRTCELRDNLHAGAPLACLSSSMGSGKSSRRQA
jgi:hypothetical protein